MKKKVALISQGCRLNHSETAALVNSFANHGAAEVSIENNPDIVIINTCTVTENGDKDTLKLIRKINQSCQNAKIALIGCQAQIKKNNLLSLKNVEWVIGNQQKKDAAQIVLNQKGGGYFEPFSSNTFKQNFSSFDARHTRVNLKIQDGCNFYCSFCIIPFARGPARSRDFSNILDDAKALINMGVKELVLTGINCGTYNHDGRLFEDILEALLNLNPACRIRISSIEPTTVTKNVVRLWKLYPNFCRYLHLPVQSCTNDVLRLMRRKYTIEEYDEFLAFVVECVPNICIGTDVIVGFPGETDELFRKTKAYLKHSPIHYFHVFSYSERQMAHSRKFDNKIDQKIINNRSFQLRTLNDIKWKTFLTKNTNTNATVIFEQKKGAYWVGSTEHFIKVWVKSPLNLKNKACPTQLTHIDNHRMMGELA
jgi:threonylcarbamoyladenosine tRNA methylthiotransferase MtaB